MTDFAKAFLACWAAVALVVLLGILLLGCASTSVATQVRRVDTIVEVDRLGDDLGRDGWHVVAVTHDHTGSRWVVVLERQVPQ